METIINSLKINYIKRGNNEKTVIILPGWGTTIDTYKVLINDIEKYSNVICLDMPGFGNSQEPKNSWNIDDFVDFIIRFINKLEIKQLDFIGHSNGGRIIIKLMNKKNLNFKVNKIILIGSAGIAHKKSLYVKIRIKVFKICKKIANIKFIKKILPNLESKIKKRFGSEDYNNSTPIMRQTMVKLLNEDLTNYLKNIKVPTLLLWGENDTATPLSDAKIMESKIPDCGLVSIPNCSHYVFLERTSYINKIIKTFLMGEEK